MNDEFKKLDQLVQRTIPDSNRPLKILILPEYHARWLKGIVVSASLVLVVLVTQNKRQFNQTEDIIALEEVMSWDIAADESVSEIEEVIEFIE